MNDSSTAETMDLDDRCERYVEYKRQYQQSVYLACWSFRGSGKVHVCKKVRKYYMRPKWSRPGRCNCPCIPKCFETKYEGMEFEDEEWSWDDEGGVRVEFGKSTTKEMTKDNKLIVDVKLKVTRLKTGKEARIKEWPDGDKKKERDDLPLINMYTGHILTPQREPRITDYLAPKQAIVRFEQTSAEVHCAAEATGVPGIDKGTTKIKK